MQETGDIYLAESSTVAHECSNICVFQTRVNQEEFTGVLDF